MDDLILATDGEGSLTNRYLHGQRVDELLADESLIDVSPVTLWGLTDHQGTARDIVRYDDLTEETTVTAHRVYDAFGDLLETIDPATDDPIDPESPEADYRAGYTGGDHDHDTGLTRLGERWYDPATGTWLSPDPIGFEGDPGNIQRYVGNSPTNFTDPAGLGYLEKDGSSVYYVPTYFGIAGSREYVGEFHDGYISRGTGTNTRYISYSDISAIIANGERPAKDWDKYFEQRGLRHEAQLPLNVRGELQFAGRSFDYAGANTYIHPRTGDVYHIDESGVVVHVDEKPNADRIDPIRTEAEETFQYWNNLEKGGGRGARTFGSGGTLETCMNMLPGGASPRGGRARPNVQGPEKAWGAPLTRAATTPARRQYHGGFSGHRGFELKNHSQQPVRNSPTKIGDRKFSGHALDQMQNRGIPPSVVEHTIKNGVRFAGNRPGTQGFYDSRNGVRVIVNSDNGTVVTVIYGEGSRQ